MMPRPKVMAERTLASCAERALPASLGPLPPCAWAPWHSAQCCAYDACATAAMASGVPVSSAAAAPSGDDTGLSGSERAEAALAEGAPDAIAVVAQGLYAQHCAMCHGAQAQGGSGPRLAGNARSAQEANVRSAITFGRGIMPGFGAILSDPEIEVLVRWLATDVATPR